MIARRLLVVVLSASLLGACVAVPPEPYAETIIVAPPPLRVENPGYPPYAGYVWTTGYWSWGGRQHVWVPGRWVAPRPGHVWVAPRWVQEGRYWRMHDGRWERPQPKPAVTAPPRPGPDGWRPNAEPPATRPAIRPDFPPGGAPRPGETLLPPRDKHEVRQAPPKTPDWRAPVYSTQDRHELKEARPMLRPDSKPNIKPDAKPGARMNVWSGERPGAAPPARSISPQPQNKPEIRPETRPETGQAPRQPPQGEARAPRQGGDATQAQRPDAAKWQAGNDSTRSAPRLNLRPNPGPGDGRRSR